MGLFDDFGGGTGNPLLDGMFTPDQLADMSRRNAWGALANFGAGLASQRGWGPGLAAGAQLATRGINEGQDRMLKQALTGHQLTLAQRKAGADAMFAKALAGEGAPAAPGGFNGPVPAGGVASPPQGPAGAPSLSPEDTAAIAETARRLQVDPAHLTTAMLYETGGKMGAGTPGQGPAAGRFGLIQFGPEEARTYGAAPGQSLTEQLGAVERYLKGRGLPAGADLLTIYKTINGGNPNVPAEFRDGSGKPISEHVAAMDARFGPAARAMFGGGGGVPAGSAPPASAPGGTAFADMLRAVSPQDRAIAASMATAGDRQGALKVITDAYERGVKARDSRVSEANKDVIIGPDGRPMVNPVTIDAKVAAQRAQAQIDAQAKGGAPEHEFNQEQKLRTDYIAQTKPFAEYRGHYQRVVAAGEKPSAAGDIAMVYGFMKMLDPGSVVREGEFATAANAGGVDDRIRTVYNKVINGERLTPEIRADFLDRSARIFDKSYGEYEATRRTFDALAKQYRLDGARVAPDLTLGVGRPVLKAEPETGRPAGAPQGAPGAPPAAGPWQRYGR